MDFIGLHETIIKIPWVAMHQCLASIHIFPGKIVYRTDQKIISVMQGSDCPEGIRSEYPYGIITKRIYPEFS
jgi:hypothetical protein